MGKSSKSSDVIAADASASPVVYSGGTKREDKEQFEKKKPEVDNMFKKREWSLNAHYPIPCDSCWELRIKSDIGAAASPAKKKDEPLTPSTPQLVNNRALRTVTVQGLSPSITLSQLIDFFKAAGEIYDVRLSRCWDDGTSRGFGQIEFATEEAALEAMKFNFRKFMGCTVEVSLPPLAISIEGFDTSSSIDEIWSSLKDHFSTCGEIIWVYIVTDKHTGAPEGIAFIEFSCRQAFLNALAMNGHKFGDSPLIIQDILPKILNMRKFKSGLLQSKGTFGTQYYGICYMERHRSKRGYGGDGLGRNGSYNLFSGKKIKFDDDDDDD